MSTDNNPKKLPCGFCGAIGTEIHKDHIIPHSRNGGDDAQNCIISCAACNLSKGNKTPSEWNPIGLPEWIYEVENLLVAKYKMPPRVRKPMPSGERSEERPPERSPTDIWTQREGEEGPAWRAFAQWRDQGDKRNLNALGRPLAEVLAWRAQWSWDARIQAYDAWVRAAHAETQTRIRIATIEQERAEHLRCAGGVLAREWEKFWHRVSAGEHNELTPDQLFRLTTMYYQWLAVGKDAGESSAGVVGGEMLGLSIDELQSALNRIKK